MFYLLFVDIYFSLLTQYILRVTITTFIIGCFLYPSKQKYNIINLLVYITLVMLIYCIFLITSSLIKDIPAYLKDDYEIKSGIITDVDFKYSKSGNYYIDELYIDEEKYHYNLYSISKDNFERNWGLNKPVTITYLKNSKEITLHP